MTEIGPLGRPRRGVSIGAFLVWVLIAAAAGAVGWEIYGNAVRAQLGIGRDQTPTSPAPSVAAPANDNLDAAVKDVQASEKSISDQLEAALVLLNAQQAASKMMADSLAAMADSLAALSAKVDALQRPPAPAPAAKRPAVTKPPPAPRPPIAISPEPEPAPAPGTAAPRDQ